MRAQVPGPDGGEQPGSSNPLRLPVPGQNICGALRTHCGGGRSSLAPDETVILLTSPLHHY